MVFLFSKNLRIVFFFLKLCAILWRYIALFKLIFISWNVDLFFWEMIKLSSKCKTEPFIQQILFFFLTSCQSLCSCNWLHADSSVCLPRALLLLGVHTGALLHMCTVSCWTGALKTNEQLLSTCCLSIGV